MKAVERELNALQKERQRVEADVANANKALRETHQTLGEATGQLHGVTTKIQALQRLFGDVRTTRSAIASQRQAAEREIEAAKQFHSELLTQLNNKIPKADRDDIQAAIEAVDAAIGDLRKKVEPLRHKRAQAEAAAAEAKRNVAAANEELRTTVSELRGLPAQIRAARGEVSKLAGSVKTAIASGRAREALYLLCEFERALNELSQLISAKKEEDLADRLDKQWRESSAASTDNVEKTALLGQVGRDTNLAESELQRKLHQREADIKAALNENERGKAATKRQQARPGARRNRGRRARKTDQ